MANLHKYRRKGHPSVQALLDQIPDDGCILVFNGSHRNWRSKASTLGFLQVTKLGPETIGRDDNVTLTDLVVTWREHD